MKTPSENFKELKHIILSSKRFNVRNDFHLYSLMEEISKQIDKETLYYLIDVNLSEQTPNNLTDEAFIMTAEEQGNVYTKEGFQKAFNEDEINTSRSFLRILEVK